MYVRACGMGTDLRHQLRLTGGGDVAFVGYGPRAAVPWSVAGLGDVWLEPSQTAVEIVSGVAGECRVEAALPIPVIPALRGSEWFFQALVSPDGASPFLTEPVPFRAGLDRTIEWFRSR